MKVQLLFPSNVYVMLFSFRCNRSMVEVLFFSSSRISLSHGFDCLNYCKKKGDHLVFSDKGDKPGGYVCILHMLKIA